MNGCRLASRVGACSRIVGWHGFELGGVLSRSEYVDHNWQRGNRGSHVVGVDGVVWVWHQWGSPAIYVDVIMVGLVVDGGVCHMDVGSVLWHCPLDVWIWGVAAETEEMGRTVHPVVAVVEKPYASEVNGHENLFPSVGIVSEKPYFIIVRIHFLGPNVGDEHVGLQFVFISAIDNHFVLMFQVVNHAIGLAS